MQSIEAKHKKLSIGKCIRTAFFFGGYGKYIMMSKDQTCVALLMVGMHCHLFSLPGDAYIPLC